MAYAHHYLRLERDSIPAGLGQVDDALTLDDAMHLVQLWCGMTGERIDYAVHRLAGAYLRRWGINRRRAGAGSGRARSSDAALGELPSGGSAGSWWHR